MQIDIRQIGCGMPRTASKESGSKEQNEKEISEQDEVWN
jgi:hypothetical protein